MNNGFESDLLIMLIAMAISMALIPLLIRWAPVLGMIDRPDPRKVHAVPVPRVGGVGIVVGALIPLAIWLPWNDLAVSFFVGSVVLLVFGVWDDIKELGHYAKFIGQFIAVVTVVYYGDLYVSHLPLMGLDAIGESGGKIFTVLAMVGMINAINHSDGLDGLAGGESLLSLGAIVYLAFQANDPIVVSISLATIGGVFGFMRFNSHPARVFMGDGGSQFLGFTLGFLAVYLTQVSNTALSPALPVLLLGLPIVDIIAVFAQRAYGGMNWFRATKNHIHHRLLELRFQHYESVIFIYSVQALLVVCGVLMPYESDVLLLGVYSGVSVAVFGFLIVAERRGWQLHQQREESALNTIATSLSPESGLMTVDRGLIKALLSIFLVAGAIFTTHVPADVSIAAGILFLLLLARMVFGYRLWFLFMRLIVYVAVAFVAYLLQFYPPAALEARGEMLIIFYGILGVSVALAVRYSKGEFFQANPLDYLVVLIVLVLAIVSKMGYTDTSTVAMVVELIILFYGAEVVVKHMSNRWNAFTVSGLTSLAIIAVRGAI